MLQTCWFSLLPVRFITSPYIFQSEQYVLFEHKYFHANTSAEYSTTMSRGWRGDSVVKGTSYSYREPEFGSQHSNWAIHNHLYLQFPRIQHVQHLQGPALTCLYPHTDTYLKLSLFKKRWWDINIVKINEVDP